MSDLREMEKELTRQEVARKAKLVANALEFISAHRDEHTRMRVVIDQNGPHESVEVECGLLDEVSRRVDLSFATDNRQATCERLPRRLPPSPEASNYQWIHQGATHEEMDRTILEGRGEPEVWQALSVEGYVHLNSMIGVQVLTGKGIERRRELRQTEESRDVAALKSANTVLRTKLADAEHNLEVRSAELHESREKRKELHTASNAEVDRLRKKVRIAERDVCIKSQMYSDRNTDWERANATIDRMNKEIREMKKKHCKKKHCEGSLCEVRQQLALADGTLARIRSVL